jgi:hypothetical protein
VPGYVAPESTVGPYVRLTAALVRPLQDAQRAGRLQAAPATTAPPAQVAAALQPVTDGLLPGVPVEIVSVALQAWATLTGIINLELFGHWRNTVWDPGLFFEETVARLGATIGLRP